MSGGIEGGMQGGREGGREGGRRAPPVLARSIHTEGKEGGGEGKKKGGREGGREGHVRREGGLAPLGEKHSVGGCCDVTFWRAVGLPGV